MGHSTPSERQKYHFKPSFVGERVADFLEELHPVKTDDNVAADLAPWGISRDTISQMRKRKTAPGVIMMLALIWAYGPEFLSEVHPAPLGWLSDAAREQKQAVLDAKIAALMAEREQLR